MAETFAELVRAAIAARGDRSPVRVYQTAPDGEETEADFDALAADFVKDAANG